MGDDIVKEHLPALRQNVATLRRLAPDVPTVADYIAEWDAESRRTYRKYIDICCNYY